MQSGSCKCSRELKTGQIVVTRAAYLRVLCIADETTHEQSLSTVEKCCSLKAAF